MKTSKQALRPSHVSSWLIPILLFLAAFLPRATYPISRPLVWSDRAIRFSDALAAGNWIETYQHYHPGVTVMWLSGIALHWFAQQNGGLSADQLFGTEPVKPGILTASVAAGILPLALVLALSITLIYLLLKKLVGFKLALASGFFLALDPFHITYSKVIHPDALLATFMLTSVSFLLVYRQQKYSRYLVGSGVFAGLSLLSKTAAVYLLPFTVLILSTNSIVAVYQSQGKLWKPVTKRLFYELLIWSGTTAAVFIALWPAMWVEPLTVLSHMADGITLHTTEAHMNPVYFNGTASLADPGVAFYLATLAWKSTAVTLPLIILSFLFLTFRLRTQEGQLALSMITYGFFFILQMSLGHWKQIPYILPVSPALSVLAAVGLIWFHEALRGWRSWRPAFSVIYFTILLGWQIFIIISVYPYYGAHHNKLLGGSRVAQRILPLQDNGEGLDLAGDYLSQLPHGQMETAAILVRSASVFQRTFNGRVIHDMVPWATYRVYDINQVMRQVGDEAWQSAWQQDQATTPLYTVAFDGVTYVWVYGRLPQPPAPHSPTQDVNYRLGDHIQLQQTRLSTQTLVPGDSLTIVLIWQSDGQVDRSYTVFNHLLSSKRELQAQVDSIPLAGIRPTQTWLDGERMEDSYLLQLNTEIPPGNYELSVGMYDSQTLQRLPVYDGDGQRMPDDRIVLGTIEVVNQEK